VGGEGRGKDDINSSPLFAHTVQTDQEKGKKKGEKKKDR